MSSDNDKIMSSSAPPRKKSRLRKIICRSTRIVGWIIAVIFIMACIYIFTPLGNVAYRHLVTTDELEPVDYIVVLGGGTDRIIEAANLYRNGYAAKVIITTSGTDVSDLTELAIQYGIAPNVITLESESRCTSDHPGKIAALPDIYPPTTKLIIVTSPVHTSRAKACFVKAGFRNIILTCPGWQKELSTPPNWMGRAVQMAPVVYEYLAWGYYWFKCRI